MYIELGHMALILALVLAGFATLNAARRTSPNSGLTPKILWLPVLTAFSCLAWAFYSNDYSVAYVAHNSNALTPWYYRLTAVWGAHEGSLLLWILWLSVWAGLFAWRSRSYDRDYSRYATGTILIVFMALTSFLLFTSNPFLRYLPFSPAEGSDLNPLLQDPGLAVHPPILYLGYVGLVLPFAMAVSALIKGEFTSKMAQQMRPWVLLSWAWLTIGIVLGSFWAYYELGWGGYWFWDPVENASFMPWLASGALLHALKLAETREDAKAFVMLLAILAFGLSLVGTFIVRSGVITSVHAFANDPQRGLYILLLLGVIIGGALTLYSMRAHKLASRSSFAMYSKEIILWLSAAIFTVACFTVLLGTLYPLIIDVLGAGKISVGPPYYNLVFLPLCYFGFSAMAFAPILPWYKAAKLSPAYLFLAIGFVTLFAGTWYLLNRNLSAHFIMAMALFLWLLIWWVYDFKNRSAKTRSYYAMTLAHLGVMITALGIAISSQFSQEQDLRLQLDEHFVMAGVDWHFAGMKDITGPNYQAYQAKLF